ncbi:MAG: serine hydrolase [Planctomycetota bacterium]
MSSVTPSGRHGRSLRVLLAFVVATVLVAVAPRAQVAVYHGVTAATHQTQWTNLSGQGYRPLALSVSGGLAAQRYSAVWVRRIGAVYAGVHGLTRAQYQSWRTTTIAAGYRPFLVTASGQGSDEVFAAVYLRDNVTAVDEVAASGSSLDSRMSWARSNGYIPTCFEEFGSSATPLYCGVWVPYSGDAAWGYSRGQSATQYQATFDAQTEGHARPTFVDISDRQTYSAIWRDDQIGSWAALHDLTAAAVQTEVNNRPNEFPLFLQCGGTGSAARWVTVFVQNDAILPRTLTRTGTAVISMDPFDSYMANLIQSTNARAASIAIAKDGRLVYARGYTWAEAGYPITQPTSMFRVASCSKPLAALAAHVLDQNNVFFSMSTLVGANLGLVGSFADFQDVRVRHAIQHSSGIVRDIDSWPVAQWLNQGSPTLPVTAWDTARYASLQPLQFAPGTGDSYSNIAYTLLGQVLENVAGKTYERVLREDVAAPLGVTRLWIGGSRRSQLRSGEVFYHDDALNLASSDLHTDRRPLTCTYGGGSYGNVPRIDAPGGVVTSAVDYVRILTGAYDLAQDGMLLSTTTRDAVLAAPVAPVAVDLGGFAQDVRPGGVVAHGKSGVLWGVSSQVIYRSDGISIAVFVNKSNSHANRDSLNSIADGMTSWPTHDLFPQHGLPAYARVVPRVTGVSPATLPNVTDQPFVIEGEVLTGVDRVAFGSTTITSRSGSTWADGWFEIRDDRHLAVFPPQGLLPTTYSIRLYNGLYASPSIDVSLSRQTARILGGPSSSRTGFDLVASRGASSSSADALLCFSLLATPSSLPGVVDLGIGAGFTQIWTWPTTVPFNLLTGAARWSVPDLGPATLHFQALIVDPRSINPLPFPTTNVQTVQSF